MKDKKVECKNKYFKLILEDDNEFYEIFVQGEPKVIKQNDKLYWQMYIVNHEGLFAWSKTLALAPYPRARITYMNEVELIDVK